MTQDQDKITIPLDHLAQLEDTARALIERHIYSYEDTYLHFSGGKDSLVLAHLLEPWRDRLTLVWFNTGIMAPHMETFIRGFGERCRLREVKTPNPMDLWEVYGVPSEVVPLYNSYGVLPHKMVAVGICCQRSRVGPLQDFTLDHPEALHIAGLKADDSLVYAKLEDCQVYIDHQSTCLYPLWNWSQTDVMRYVARHDVELPMQYRVGVIDSLECLACPTNLSRNRMDFMREHYPETAQRVLVFAEANIEACDDAMNRLRLAISEQPYVRPF